MFKKVVFASVLGMICCSTGFSQSVTAASGGQFENSQGQVSFTLGEPVIETIGDASNTLTQGFHQSKLTVVGIYENLKEISVKIFPNPTSETANVQFEGLDAQDYELQLFDVNGSLVQIPTSQTASNLVQLKLNSMAAGTYFLQVKSKKNNDEVNAYRIIKSH